MHVLCIGKSKPGLHPNLVPSLDIGDLFTADQLRGLGAVPVCQQRHLPRLATLSSSVFSIPPSGPISLFHARPTLAVAENSGTVSTQPSPDVSPSLTPSLSVRNIAGCSVLPLISAPTHLFTSSTHSSQLVRRSVNQKDSRSPVVTSSSAKGNLLCPDNTVHTGRCGRVGLCLLPLMMD